MNRKLKRNIILISVISVVLIVSAILVYFFVFYNKTLATVDGMGIKQKEVNTYMNFIKAQSGDGKLPESEEELKTLKGNIIDILIGKKLLEKYAEENNIVVTSEEVDEQLNGIIGSYDSEEDFNDYLKDIGISRGFLEGELRRRILTEKIYNEVTTDKIITDQEAKEYYNEKKENYLVPASVKASRILAAFPWILDSSIEETEEGRQEALEKIEIVEDKLKNGGDFEELAKQYSDDKSTAENGGDLGYIYKGQTSEELEKVLFSLDVGEVSDVIEAEYGFYILKVFDIQEEHYQDFEEVKEDIKAYLLDLHKMEEYSDYFFSLVDKADIKFYIDVESTLKKFQEENK